MACGIYRIVAPDGKMYIGKAIDIHNRWGTYKRLGCISQSLIYESLVKYGHEKHLFEILEECAFEDLYVYEAYYIYKYDSCQTEHGLNLINNVKDRVFYYNINPDNKKQALSVLRSIIDTKKPLNCEEWINEVKHSIETYKIAIYKDVLFDHYAQKNQMLNTALEWVYRNGYYTGNISEENIAIPFSRNPFYNIKNISELTKQDYRSIDGMIYGHFFLAGKKVELVLYGNKSDRFRFKFEEFLNDNRIIIHKLDNDIKSLIFKLNKSNDEIEKEKLDWKIYRKINEMLERKFKDKTINEIKYK